MAHRRCLHALTRHAAALLSSTPPPSPPPPSLLETPFSTLKPLFISLKTQKSPSIFWPAWWGSHTRHFSSNRNDGSENEDEIEEISDGEEENDDDDEEEEEEEDGDYGNTASGLAREYSVEEKEAEAAAIGYKVVGPLEKSDRVFKPYEPVFAVVQIGSHQFKVSNGDCIFTEKLKFCEVNDKLILNKVLLVGSASQTIIGRPIVPDAAVHAVVEEHALDAKVIIFKKKRRKNYRRTKGHRQELTKLRITDIQGIEKPEMKVEGKPSKAAAKKAEKVAVAA